MDADLNGDGYRDLFLAGVQTMGTGGNVFFVLPGLASGKFGLSTSVVFANPVTFQQVTSVRAANLNGDGYMDIAIAGVFTPNGQGKTYGILAALSGVNTGSFMVEKYTVLTSTPSSLSVQDLNDDRQMDLVALTDIAGSSVVMYLPGRGNGTFNGPGLFPLGTQALMHRMLVKDMNLDGLPDAVLWDATDSRVRIMLGGPGQMFHDSGQEYQLPGGPSSLDLGDMNYDGLPDLAITYGTGTPLEIRLNSP